MKLSTRVHDRVRYKTWVKVIPPHGNSLLGHISDISSAGLGVEHEQPSVDDSVCNVYFMLPYQGREHIVQARCRIASCRPLDDGRFHIGLAFVEFISDPRRTADLVTAFIKQLEQDA